MNITLTDISLYHILQTDWSTVHNAYQMILTFFGGLSEKTCSLLSKVMSQRMCQRTLPEQNGGICQWLGV